MSTASSVLKLPVHDGSTTDHWPVSPDRGIVVRLENASPRSCGRNRKSINHETHETHEKKAKAEIRQAWVRKKVEIPLRWELIVGVDCPIDSFNQLCAAFLSCDSCVSWLMISYSGRESARRRWIDDRPRACLAGPRHCGAA